MSASKLNACNRTERSHSCANAETAEGCKSSCGLASGIFRCGIYHATPAVRAAVQCHSKRFAVSAFSRGSYSGRCAWRHSKRSNDVSGMSDRYPTCSPDLTHCPDNRCDELEQLDPRICPQDCAPECKRSTPKLCRATRAFHRFPVFPRKGETVNRAMSCFSEPAFRPREQKWSRDQERRGHLRVRRYAAVHLQRRAVLRAERSFRQR